MRYSTEVILYIGFIVNYTVTIKIIFLKKRRKRVSVKIVIVQNNTAFVFAIKIVI